jgi:hypothetical protein
MYGVFGAAFFFKSFLFTLSFSTFNLFYFVESKFNFRWVVELFINILFWVFDSLDCFDKSNFFWADDENS